MIWGPPAAHGGVGTGASRHRVHLTVAACATRTSFYRSCVTKNLGKIKGFVE
jgi:hypothetical protein